MITYNYFLRNREIYTIDKAVIPLSDVEYSYGFGVYETIRVKNGKPYFLAEHAERLLNSAKIISLDHTYSSDEILRSALELIKQNQAETCNLKILLIGGRTAETANFYMLCLNPHFPDRQLYKTGAHAVTEPYERPFPHAKTLNMLPSYLAFRKAKQVNAYDALCINKEGNITEGTRTNFFVIKDKTIISPPESEILPGVTRHYVLEIARQNGYEVVERGIPLNSLDQYDGAFLTSTSSKIMPLRSIDDHAWPGLAPTLQELMTAFNDFLAEYK